MMEGGLKLAPLLTEIKVDIKGFKSQMEQAKTAGATEADKISSKLSNVSKVGDKLSGMGGALTKGLTVPLASAGVAAGKMAMDYETNFAKVSTLLDKNKVDYKQYSNDLLDASGESKVAVGEFSEAVYQSISAGVDQTKAIGFTTEAMKLAKGGFTDGAKAVDVLTTAINSYGMEADDVTKVSDMLITTQNLGKTTVDELSSSLGNVIPIASQSGMSLEELMTVIATLTKNGIGTSESITGVKAALSNIIKPSEEAAKAADALGLDFSASAMQSKGFAGFMGDVKAALQIAAPEFATLSDKVVKNRAALAEMEGQGKKNTEEYKNLAKETKGMEKEMDLLSKAADSNIGGFATLFGSVEGLNSMMVLASDTGGKDMQNILHEMETSAGSTQEAFEKMDSTPAEKLKGALNELKNGAIKLGESFIPIADKIADKLSDLAKWFGSLTDEQQENIIKWGGVLAVAGPVLKVVGGGIKTFTNLSSAVGGLTKFLGIAGSGSAASGLIGGLGALSSVALPIAGIIAGVGTAIYAVHEHGDLMNSTITKSRDEMSWMEKVMADLSGTSTYTKEELEKMGYVHKDFSENISPEFQKAVEDADQDIQNFNISLQETSFDGVLTQEESDGLRQRVNDMVSGAIATIQGKKNEVQNALSETFNADGVLSLDEQTLLNYYNEKYDRATTEEYKLRDQIHDIMQGAANDKRELNDQEVEQIREKTQKIRQIELEALGGTEEEIMYAKNEFAARVENMDLESASKLLQQKAKDRDEQIVQIKAGFDTQIELLRSNLNSMDAEERQAAEREIKKLENDKQRKIAEQDDLYKQYTQIIRDGNAGMLDEINKFTGEVLTQGDREKQGQLEKMREQYAGLEQIQSSGCYTIYDKYNQHYTNVGVLIDEKTGELLSVYDVTTRDVGAYCKQMGEDAEKMATRHDASFQAIMDKEVYYVESTHEFVDSSGERVTAIGEIQTQADGTKTAILELNGTPVNVVVDENGTCRQILSDIESQSYAASGDRYLTYHVNYEEMYRPILDNYYNGGGDGYGWHYNGLDNVPYDGYRAILHKDERVLTAEENKEYSSGQKQTIINFNGSYGFNNREDIDYFMNQAALRIAGARA